MNSISATVITFNEERNIGRCLESLAGVADEIIVVDSFSTDRTEEICARHGVRFFKHPFAGYTDQKNIAIEKASNRWILSLDADEALSEELKESILKVKESPEADAYEFNRLTNYCGKWIRHGSWYPDRKVRLIDRSKGKWTGGSLHEQLLPDPNAKLKHLPGDLLHYSYYSIEDHISQVNKFTTIGARNAFEKGKKPGWFDFLIKPLFKFVRDYIFKGGFRDGYYGFVIARISAHATYLKYAKLKELTGRK